MFPPHQVALFLFLDVLDCAVRKRKRGGKRLCWAARADAAAALDQAGVKGAVASS